MGLFTAIGLGAGLIGGEINREAQDRAINLRLKQEQVAESERSTQRTRRLNDVLANQVAQEGASGFNASSPSFFAIGADSINQFAQDENADALNLSFDNINAANAKKNAVSQEVFGDVGSAVHAGETAYEGSFNDPNIDPGAVAAGRNALGEPL